MAGIPDLERQLRETTLLLERRQKDLEILKRNLATFGKDPARVKLINQQITNTQATLKGIVDRQTKLQNEVYKAKGNYEGMLEGKDRDAYLAVTALFKQYGLESLAGKIFEFVKNGYSADTISILLQDTPEYKQRFIGNEARRKAGLPVLNPAEYLATEAAYRQIMEGAGLPKGFYDQTSDFAGFIGSNVSPTEIQSRVEGAVQATTLAPEDYKQALEKMGLSQADMVAYWLDQKKSLPILTQIAATARIGAEALSQGLNFNVEYSTELAKRGITAEQAAQGYSAIASELESMQTLGSIYGQQWNQRASEQAMFEGDAGMLDRKRRLASQERGSFSGAVGGARGGLAGKGGQR